MCSKLGVVKNSGYMLAKLSIVLDVVPCRTLGYDEKAMASRMTVTESVDQLLHTIDHLSAKDSGRFLNTDGSPIPF